MMNQQYVFHTKVHSDWVDHNGHLMMQCIIEFSVIQQMIG